MAEQTCRLGWQVCPQNFSVIILDSVISASAYAYLMYLVRYCSRDKRYKYIRWVVGIGVTLHWLQAMLDRFAFAGEASIVSVLLGVVVLMANVYPIYKWVYNILSTVFATLEMQVPKWISVGTWVMYAVQMVCHAVLSIGTTELDGSACPPWLIAQRIQTTAIIASFAIPLVCSYGFLLFIIRGHMKSLHESFPLADMGVLDSIKRRLGRTTLIASVVSLVFSLGNTASIISAQSDPYDLDTAAECAPFSLSVSTILKVAIFFPPLVHTHVKRRPKSSFVTPVRVKEDKSPSTTGLMNIEIATSRSTTRLTNH